jgi:1-pyrroline-5-carboxylate dehydrogenase
LEDALARMKAQSFKVPCVVNGKPVSTADDCDCSIIAHLAMLTFQVETGKIAYQLNPSDHARHLCVYHEATPEVVASAIEGALAAKLAWETLPWNDRAAIFLKAADLISGKYRYELMAATMLGQGKNAWQAEIDAAVEVTGTSGCCLGRC